MIQTLGPWTKPIRSTLVATSGNSAEINFKVISKAYKSNHEQQLDNGTFGAMSELHGTDVEIKRGAINGAIRGSVRRPTNIKSDANLKIVSLINDDANIVYRKIESIRMLVTFAPDKGILRCTISGSNEKVWSEDKKDRFVTDQALLMDLENLFGSGKESFGAELESGGPLMETPCNRLPIPMRPIGKKHSFFGIPVQTTLHIRPQGLEKFGGHNHGIRTGADVGALDKDRMPPRESMFNDGHGNKIFGSAQEIPIMLIVGLPGVSRFATRVTLVSIGTI